MDKLREPHERLRWAREQAGYESASAAADAMGLKNTSTYNSHENGWRGFIQAADRYANFFKVSYEWLTTGRGSPYPARPGDDLSTGKVPPVKKVESMVNDTVGGSNIEEMPMPKDDDEVRLLLNFRNLDTPRKAMILTILDELRLAAGAMERPFERGRGVS